jgi:hypothetical protein
MSWLNKLPWGVLIIGSLFLGLSPFVPEPHLFEKVRMLFDGSLHKSMDIFDLFLHGSFPLLLSLKILYSIIIK